MYLTAREGYVHVATTFSPNGADNCPEQRLRQVERVSRFPGILSASVELRILFASFPLAQLTPGR